MLPLLIIGKCDAFAFEAEKNQPPTTAGHHAAMMTAPPATQGSSDGRGAGAAQPHSGQNAPSENRAPHHRADQRGDLDRLRRSVRQQLEQIDPKPEQQRDHRGRRRLIAQCDEAVAETPRRPEPARDPRAGRVQHRKRAGQQPASPRSSSR